MVRYVWLSIIVLLVVCLQTMNDPLVFDSIEGCRYYVQTHFSDWTLASVLHGSRMLAHATFGEIYKFTDNIMLQRGFNLALHILNIWLMYSLVLRVLKNKNIAGLMAVLFGLSPAMLFAVVYLGERTIEMAVTFGLVQMIFCYDGMVIKQIKDKVFYLLLSLVAYVCAISCKEHAAALIVIYPVMAVFFRQWWIFGLSLIPIGGLVYLSLGNKNIQFENGPYNDVVQKLCGIKDVDEYRGSVITQSVLFFKYFYHWLNPFAVKAIDMREPFLTNQFWLIPFLVWNVLGVILLLRRSVVGFGMMLMSGLFGIELATVRIGEIFVLYRSYLYAIGYMIFIGGVIKAAGLNAKTIRTLSACLIVVLGYATYNEAGKFESTLSVWRAARDRGGPACQMARIESNLGAELIAVKKYDEAIEVLSKAEDVGYELSTLNKAAALVFKGEFVAAHECYVKAAGSSDPKIKAAAERELSSFGLSGQ